MVEEKDPKDFDVVSLSEPDIKLPETTPDIRKRRRRILWLAGLCGVIVIIALVVVVAIVVLKSENSNGGGTQGGQQGSDGVTSRTEEWSQWGTCNVSCGRGHRTRVRNSCPPSNGTCVKERTRSCWFPDCPS